MSYEHRRAAVKQILETLPADEQGLIAALGMFATDAMDEAERSKERIKLLEERLAHIKSVAGGVGATAQEVTLTIHAFKFHVEQEGIDVKPVTFTRAEEPAKKPYSSKRSTPCDLALRLLSPDEPCRDPDCGFPASEHKNYNGMSK